MGVDIMNFVAARDKAFTAFVLNDDWEPVLEYCHTYGVTMPKNPDVMAAGIYKAVQECTSIPDEVKIKAAMKCMALGFKPYMMPIIPKEDSMNYKLNVQDGKVDYLMMAGKDVVRATTTEERAQWAMNAKGVKYECIGGHPEYAIHCGEFFFASVPVKSRKRKKDAVCGNDYCELE